jgi:hypothetical protein
MVVICNNKQIKTMKNDIAKIIESIRDCLNSQRPKLNSGLLSGEAGVLLFEHV